jgi:hypothetical protein
MSDISDINEGRVDSRAKTARQTHPTLPLERTYCAFCGKPKGWVTHESGDFIDAQNVVVVCDDCNSKFDKALGPLPGEVGIPEYNLREAGLSFNELELTSDWVENCIHCRLPMVKLQPIAASKCVPLLETLHVGGAVLDANRRAGIERGKQNAVPTWFCRKCKSLWGPIDMFWCKFKKI